MSDEEYEYEDGEGGYEYDDDPKLAAAAAVEAAGGSGGGPAAVVGAEYRIVGPAEIRAEMDRAVAEVGPVLSIPLECARTLLIHFRWNKEQLFDRYYANPAAVQKDAGIEHLGVSGHPPAPISCDICLTDNVPVLAAFALGCKHFFCKGCWDGYLSSVVNDDGAQCIFARCPAEGCMEVVTPQLFRTMPPPDVSERYERFVQHSFVNINRTMSWCPAAGCANSFMARGPVANVKCPCGMQSCFKCSSEAHQPIDCAGLLKWQQKCNNESETVNWILANTKKCPKCMVRIEKNQGCNHMVCRNKGCKNEFCWVCLGAWTDHGQATGGYYACNRYDPSKVVVDGSEGSAKAELDRYLFYFQRYENHHQAGKFAERLRETTQHRMAELQEKSESSWSDVTFLETASETLLECRRVLKYSYAYGYYMKDGREKRLFEHLQEHLEKNTEHLAELTEMPLARVNRTDLVNYTRVTQRFLNQLLEGIQEGLTSGIEGVK